MPPCIHYQLVLQDIEMLMTFPIISQHSLLYVGNFDLQIRMVLTNMKTRM